MEQLRAVGVLAPQKLLGWVTWAGKGVQNPLCWGGARGFQVRWVGGRACACVPPCPHGVGAPGVLLGGVPVPQFPRWEAVSPGALAGGCHQVPAWHRPPQCRDGAKGVAGWERTPEHPGAEPKHGALTEGFPGLFPVSWGGSLHPFPSTCPQGSTSSPSACCGMGGSRHGPPALGAPIQEILPIARVSSPPSPKSTVARCREPCSLQAAALRCMCCSL